MGAAVEPRRIALALAAARVGLGVGVGIFTRPTMKAMGFDEANSSAWALAKLGGGRDLALGLATLAAHDDSQALARLTRTAGLLDAADAITMATAARDPEVRVPAIGGIVSGGAAAIVSLWAANRLG